MITLYVGRFQPFHNGHFHDVKKALSFSGSLIIAIGSSQENNTKLNQFSFAERKEMIERAIGKRARIIAIPDVNNDEIWLSNLKSMAGHFDALYTGNERVKRIFESNGLTVKDVEILEGISSTKIRNKMHNGEEWKSMVPDDVAKYLSEIGAAERIAGFSEE